VVAALEALNKPEPRTSNVQGEASASLDEAFRALADFIENDEQLRQDETMPEVPSDVLSSGDRSAPPRLWRADEF
jgi:hypothetical protein